MWDSNQPNSTTVTKFIDSYKETKIFLTNWHLYKNQTQMIIWQVSHDVVLEVTSKLFERVRVGMKQESFFINIWQLYIHMIDSKITTPKNLPNKHLSINGSNFDKTLIFHWIL